LWLRTNPDNPDNLDNIDNTDNTENIDNTDTPEVMEELRLDEDFLAHELNKALFREYLKRMDTQALDKRVQMLSHIYQL
jgi:hypothetical protein